MREESRRLAIGIALIAALILGLLYWSREPAKPGAAPPQAAPQTVALEPEVKRPAPMAAKTPAPPPIAPVRAPPAPARIAQPEAAPEPKAGRIDFPASLQPQFTAAGFHDAFARVMAECKFDYTVDSEDCTEYPCVEWGTWAGNHIDVDECPAWKETFGEKVFVFTHDDANGQHLVGLSVLAPEVQAGAGVVPHLLARGNGMLDASGTEGTATVAGPRKEAPRRPVQRDGSELRASPGRALASGR